MLGIARLHTNFLDRLIHPELRMHSQGLMRSRILVGLIFYGSLMITIMAAVRLLSDGLVTTTLYSLVAAPVFFSLLLIFWLSRSRELTGDILILFTIILVTLTAWKDEGLYARTIFWFPVIPLIANFLAGRIRSLWSTILCWLSLLAMYVAHGQGIITTYNDIDLVEGRLAAAMAAVFFVAVISYLYEESHQRAEEERQRLSQSKNNWVSMVSHELRTPLTAIQGSLGLALGLKSASMDEQTVNMLRIANANSERLVRLVNDVLDIEKIECGQLNLSFTETNLVDILTEIELTNRDLAAGNHVKLETSSDDDNVCAVIDRDRIVQALQNLVSNAIKFSPEKSTVWIRLEHDEDHIRVSVKDSGPGISEDFKDKVFSRFTQEENLNTRKQSGSGLGLNITRAIILQHGGEVGFRNNPDRGVTFYFTLPVQPCSSL